MPPKGIMIERQIRFPVKEEKSGIACRRLDEIDRQSDCRTSDKVERGTKVSRIGQRRNKSLSRAHVIR